MTTMTSSRPASAADGPRDRLLATASALFYEEGIHAIGIDRIVSEAGVPRATLYRHFAGKEGLVLAYLRGEDAAIRGLAAAAAAAPAHEQARARHPGHRRRHRRAPHSRLPLYQRRRRVPGPRVGCACAHRLPPLLVPRHACRRGRRRGRRRRGGCRRAVGHAARCGARGGYLDGADSVARTFARAARAVTGTGPSA
ncbi:TetR/AcrR family transcriptional regulator [Demequina litorisediminis]|uniref:TetR/AcrR family transcriptional regulator n=1 Tax=Demequina litorisediminis TaxID=1849022 RepID=UPI0024E0605E|nr:TetR/AcrR family transcriptional regulator [Demequina litorisediminis]